ncbi:2094_t:CDS:2, partial [Gigaspora rosea]
TPIEVSSEATTSQQETNDVVGWNRLRTSDLRIMCFKCGLQTEGSKTELVNCLETFWSEQEIDDQNEAFFAYFNNKLEEKIDEKLTASFQEFWIEEDSKEKLEEVQERLRLRAFTLRVAEEEGWTVARKIPKPVPNEGDEFKNLLAEARKQAKSQEGYAVPYNRRTWQTKEKRFGGWSSRANYYTPYLFPHPYMQYTPPTPSTLATLPLQPHQNHGVFPNLGPTYQGMFSKTSKQLTCYYCGGAGHMASVCASRLAEGSTRGSGFFRNKTSDE